MAIREPSNGKGRYELISPYALRRLAKHYENGASKYTREIPIPEQDLLGEINKEIRKLVLERYKDHTVSGEEFVYLRDGHVVLFNPFSLKAKIYPASNNGIHYTQLLDDCHSMYIGFPISYVKGLENIEYYRLDDGGRNWEKGIPYSRYIDSAFRHLQQFMMGMTDEDHLAAASWNIFSIMHHQEMGENFLDDLPHYEDRRGKHESD